MLRTSHIINILFNLSTELTFPCTPVGYMVIFTDLVLGNLDALVTYLA
mgnify:CR=1 FL=1